MKWRLRRFVRETGLLLAIITFIVLCMGYLGGERALQAALGGVPGGILAFALVLSAGSGLRWWLRYPRLRRTLDCAEHIGRITASPLPYCLLLRTFGGDGSVLLPTRPWAGLWSPALTIEQVIARALGRERARRTCTLVDAGVRHSPPGPVYLRASNDDWEGHIATLMDHADRIVVLLAPGREMRRSLDWEIDEIRRRGLQDRVTIVLPPCGRKRKYYASHRLARREAERIVAKLGLAFPEPPPDVRELTRRAVSIRVLAGRDENNRPAHGLAVGSVELGGRRIIGAAVYDRVLAWEPRLNAAAPPAAR
ncbi:hypothetical protein [Streptomyces sp. NPDC053048]|uniref:hypothetical protein n=1 Tax=Streptomyces sp. NPDC053048 TaxID=3365694 RepID=UPI0037D2E15D